MSGMRKYFIGAFCLCLFLSGNLHADLISMPDADLISMPESPLPINSDNLASRKLHVRELLACEVGRQWVFYPPHDQLPETYPEPTPPSPDQGSIYLTEDMPLVVVIPELHHLPILATIDIAYNLVSDQLTIDAALHFGEGMTATIYGPTEYLLPIGKLAAGEYHLEFNLTHTHETIDGQALQGQNTTVFLDFQVQPAVVPEPITLSLFSLGLATIVFRRRP